MVLKTLRFFRRLLALEELLRFMLQNGRIHQQYMQLKFVDNKEAYLTNIVNGHKHIIQFYGLTKSQDEEKYSLVLEHADGGTLRDYLRDDTITFEWKDQLKFAKEIASAILWLHDDKGIVHGDLHPNNILVHQNTIKLLDFGHSFLKGSDCYNTEVWGVIPYVDSKTFDRGTSYKINEKSDIYSLGVVLWELTSRSSPFNYETKNDHISLMLDIFNGLREKPVQNTNDIFVRLYKKCWEHKPNKRPYICEINKVLNSIDSENTISYSNEEEVNEEREGEDSDLSNCGIDCDINKYKL
ncbi:kinase-like domain-containing protein [Rhizophagus diaphanus]|nr:kinase-like domain-containing protein [Rhizophagus diaphanus] [Rhizophagus sp. MUCL 43196]